MLGGDGLPDAELDGELADAARPLRERHARDTIARLGIAAEIEKVTDFDAIMDMGVMMTPALAVDGVVKRVGKILTAEQVASYIPGGDGHAL